MAGQNRSGSGGKGRVVRSGAAADRVLGNGRPSGGARTEVVQTTSTTTSTGTPPTGRRKFFTRRNILLTVAGVLLLLIGLGVLYALNEVNKRLPTINGTAQLPGLTANVSVTRDVNGVPHIVAANLQDLYRAQGYVHAQDRLYQLFFFRTAGQGRLAELFSPAQVDADIYLRTIGFRRAAEAELATLRPDVREALEWYSQGINAFVHSHRDNLPLEFTLLGRGFEDWQPVDTLAFGKLQARDLSETWQNELVKADIWERVGPEDGAKLIPPYPGDAPVTVPGQNSGQYGDVVAHYSSKIAPLLPGWNEDIGSNNWVVDGTKSVTGQPLLANDPHLGVRNPSIWYQIHLSTTDGTHDVAGFGFAGAPGIVTGHNQNIAWGVTNTGTDVQDIFLEQLDEQNHPGQYLSGDEWVPLQIITETIKVADGQTVTHRVRITNHGPILSDAFPITPTISSAISGTYSLQWSALEPGRLIEALFDLQTASNWGEFRDALSKWDVPGQNFVYADREGNIGYQMTGKVPVRRSGDGSVPAPGWTGEYDWNGYIAFDDMPRAYNPPDHFIATANNRPYGEDYGFDIPGYWAQPWRIERIRELLTAKDKLTADDFKAVLSDTTSALARRVLPTFTGIQPTQERSIQAMDKLKAWDGNVLANSPAAAIYEITYHQVLTRTFSDELGRNFSLDESNLFAQYLNAFRGEALISIANLLDAPDDALWDDKSTPQVETRDDILRASLDGAVAELTAVMGDNMNDWQWGKVHVIVPAHEFSSTDFVGGMFTLANRPIGGDNTTVSVSSYDLPVAAFPLQPFAVTGHQSYRMIIDLSDWTKAVAIFATGESGQPGSKFRENMYPLWLNYQYLPMYYDRARIDANKEGVLTLTP